MHSVIVEQIDDVLPQTQCGQCSFKGCRPYAEAIVEGRADINQCPPGGDEGIKVLAVLLGVEPKPLDPQFGQHKPKSVAVIIEEQCIGCVKCIAACPVDAIIGAPKYMHTVLTEECTGCELCIAPCPMDCIVMQPIAFEPTQKYEKAQRAKQRYYARMLRKERDALEKAERLRKKKELLTIKSAKPE